MIINDLDGYYIVFDTKNWNTELDTLLVYFPGSMTHVKTSRGSAKWVGTPRFAVLINILNIIL